MNTIFKKRGLAAVLLLSSSVSNVIPAEDFQPSSCSCPPSPYLSGAAIPNNPSSGLEAPFPAPIGEPAPVMGGSEGDQESCWSRWFGGKKSSSSECEAGSAAVSSEGSTKEGCLSCNLFSKYSRDISVISAAFALICGGIALKFHRDGKSSQDFDFFGDKISAEDAEAIEEKSKSAKFKEKIFGIGAVALGVLAVLSGWKFSARNQRVKDLEEARRLWLANQLQPHMAKPSADSPESGGLCAGEQFSTSNLVENRREQEIRGQLAELRGRSADINQGIRDLVGREGLKRDSMIRGFVGERKRLFEIQALEAELLSLKSKPSDEELLKALPKYRLAEAERIKAEKVTQAEKAEQAKELRQHELLAVGARLEQKLNIRQYPNARSLYPSDAPESPLSSSSSDSGSFSPENADQNQRPPAHLRPQPASSMRSSVAPQALPFTYLSTDRPSFSSVHSRQRSAEFSSSQLPSRLPFGQQQIPMASSSSHSNLSETIVTAEPSCFSSEVSSSDHLRHIELRDPNNFEFTLSSETPLPPSHFGNPQSETLPFSSMSSAPLPATTYVPRGSFPLNPQRDHNNFGGAGYPTASSSSSTPIAPGCRSEEGTLDRFGDGSGSMFLNAPNPQSTTSGTPLSRNRE